MAAARQFEHSPWRDVSPVNSDDTLNGYVEIPRGESTKWEFRIELNRLENEADHVSREVVAELFTGRHEVLDVMRWKEIYGRLENAADQCEDVANTIESIVIKNR